MPADKKALSERDICTKFITPALVDAAGWDLHAQRREEVALTDGRVIVRGKLVTRGKSRRADYVLYHKPNLPIAVIEAKDNTHHVGDGMQQALDYAEMLDVPFAYSSNGDSFLEHDRSGQGGTLERALALDAFPTPQELWQRYRAWKGLDEPQTAVVTQDYYADGSKKTPRYYQTVAINKTVESIAKGQDRILLVMATGTGKTYTDFQIIWRAELDNFIDPESRYPVIATTSRLMNTGADDPPVPPEPAPPGGDGPDEPPRIPPDPPEPGGKRVKYVVGDVPVWVVSERV